MLGSNEATGTVKETTRSRFVKAMRGEAPSDRLPVVEWAIWWDKTLRRWEGEGLPVGLGTTGAKGWFGLDVDIQHWFSSFAEGAGQEPYPGAWIRDESDYDALRPMLYPERIPFDLEEWQQRAELQRKGEVITWFTINGFFWWPRVLLGIEPHMLAFYDQPELMHRINRDQAEYSLRCIDALCQVCQPDFMTIAEDMSYNHGPMLSKGMFDEFLAPYYRMVVPELKRRGITVIVDSDGQVEPLIPWLEEVGVEGILPLERMAGVDVARIRAEHPNWIMIGGFDKTVMHLGEAAMRAEFERLLPVMRSGRFVLSVDHQTPPDVSLANYRVYISLLREYAHHAIQG